MPYVKYGGGTKMNRSHFHIAIIMTVGVTLVNLEYTSTLIKLLGIIVITYGAALIVLYDEWGLG